MICVSRKNLPNLSEILRQNCQRDNLIHFNFIQPSLSEVFRWTSLRWERYP